MFIAIFGTGRNGSTLLARLMDGAPGVYVHPVECNFFAAISDLIKYGKVQGNTGLNINDDALENLDCAVSVQLLLAHFSCHESEIIECYISRFEGEYQFGPYWKDMFSEYESLLPVEFVKLFLEAFARWLFPEKTFGVYAFKTIEVQYVEEYERWLKPMACVHLIRHPIGFYTSQKRSMESNKMLPRWYFGWDNLYAMIHKRWIPHAASILRNNDKKHHFVLKYEDLLESTTETLQGLLKFLDIGLYKNYEKQTILGGYLPKDLPNNPSQKGKKTAIDVVKPSDNETMSILSEKEARYIYHFTNPFLEELAYKTKNVKFGIMDVLAFEEKEFVNFDRGTNRKWYNIFRSFSSFFIRRYLYLVKFQTRQTGVYHVKNNR